MQSGQPIAYASRSLTISEINYAQIEKELLAIVFAAEHFNTYVYGRKVSVESDHKPLQAIFAKSLVSAPKRLQRMLIRLQYYDLTVTYKKGEEMTLADPLSRAYLPTTEGGNSRNEKIMAVERTEFQEEMETVDSISSIPISEERLAKIKNATAEDRECIVLMNVVQHGWPESRKETPYIIQPY